MKLKVPLGKRDLHEASVRPNACLLCLAVLGMAACSPLLAQSPTKSPATSSAEPIPLNPNRTVLLDREGKRLLVRTRVVLREGMLEMLCCPAQTKEHESILAVDSRAYVIHAGLIALGAKPGTPVQYQPAYKAPTGQPIDI